MDLFGSSKKKAPKTMKGEINKMMTGDGRRKFENLSQEEQFDCVFGSGSLVKNKNKKKSTKNKR